MLSVKETANELGVSYETVRNWDRRGIIKPIAYKGKRKFYSEEQIKTLKMSGIQVVASLNR